jgi:hypothetical protein
MWSLGRTRIVILSDLPPIECAARLDEAVGTERSLFKPVVGSVRQRSLRLRKRLPFQFYNSFQTFFTATIAADGTGTVIRGWMGMHWFVIVFLAVSLIAIALSSVNAAAPGALLGMLGFLAGLAAFGRFLARGEAEFLLDFLVKTVEGRIQNPTPSPQDR